MTGLAGVPIAQGDGSSARFTFEPSVKSTLFGIEFHGDARLRWLQLEGERRTDLDPREVTAAWRGAQTTLTVGAQQVNWGRMDILRVTDVINPVDQHDFFYEDLPESKLALWMANWEWQSGSQTVQVIATPQVPIDRLPVTFAGLPVRIDRPSNSLNNSTIAIRYGFEVAGWNADVIAVKGWQTTPSLQPVINAAGAQLQGTMAKQYGVGFSADKPLGSTVLRLEGLYARLTPQSANAQLDLAAQRQATLGAGMDWRIGPWFIAGQVIAQRTLDATPAQGSPDTIAYLSVIIQRKWLQDRLEAKAIHIRETRSGSSWTSLQMSYEVSRNQTVRLQADLFEGQLNQPFGAFRGRSRVAASARFQF